MAIWQHHKRVLGIFSPRMRRNSHLGTSLRRPRFPKRQMHFHYRVTCTAYIRCFCATTSHDLVTLTFWPWECFMYSASRSCPTHIPIFVILRLSVTELRVLNIWSHFRNLKQSLRMRRVTWPLTGGKNSPHFWNPWPQFAYSLSHFHGATTKFKLCYGQK